MQKSRDKIQGSIVLRNEDMAQYPKIYFDDLNEATKIAAYFRESCFYVDVISSEELIRS